MLRCYATILQASRYDAGIRQSRRRPQRRSSIEHLGIRALCVDIQLAIRRNEGRTLSGFCIDELSAIMKVFAVVVCLASLALGDLVGLPTVPFDAKEDGSYFDLSCVNNIIIDSKYAHTKDHDGWTLIPPSLSEFASTFAKDWSHTMGRNLSIKTGECVETESIFLTVGNNSGFQDVAGRWTSEAYAIVVEESGVTITGASPLGIWWGTRSVLQQAILNEGKIPVGKGVDSPGWNTRGIFVSASTPRNITYCCDRMLIERSSMLDVISILQAFLSRCAIGSRSGSRTHSTFT